VLTGAILAFYFDLLGTRRRAIDIAQRQRATLVVIDRIERDLAACLVGDSRHGAGVRGDATSLSILSRGLPLASGAVFGDLQRSDYRFTAGAGRLEARRGPAAVGRTAPYTPLADGIFRVRFRFHDGRGWRDRYDSLEADALPVAVEVAVWYAPWPGEGEPEVPLGAEPIERVTFDESEGFDELAFAASSDLDVFDEPAPDRVRIIAVPDARPGSGEEAAP
jgi:hypothetical protein